MPLYVSINSTRQSALTSAFDNDIRITDISFSIKADSTQWTENRMIEWLKTNNDWHSAHAQAVSHLSQDKQNIHTHIQTVQNKQKLV